MLEYNDLAQTELHQAGRRHHPRTCDHALAASVRSRSDGACLRNRGGSLAVCSTSRPHHSLEGRLRLLSTPKTACAATQHFSCIAVHAEVRRPRSHSSTSPTRPETSKVYGWEMRLYQHRSWRGRPCCTSPGLSRSGVCSSCSPPRSVSPHAQRSASITSELDCDATANRRTATDRRSYRQVGNYQRGLSPFQNRVGCD